MYMTKLFIANWKMSVSRAETAVRLAGVISESHSRSYQLVICPSFVHLPLIKGKFQLGAQNCSAHESGAYTGEISCESLKDIGAEYVIIGHSERRQYHNESDATIPHKINACHRHAMKAVVCIGEPEAVYLSGKTEDYLQMQIDEIGLAKMPHENTIIAYEPLWAIGTGKTPKVEEIDSTIKFIKKSLPEHKILYGGSVNSSNISSFYKLQSVDGFLVGGASAKEDELEKMLK